MNTAEVLECGVEGFVHPGHVEYAQGVENDVKGFEGVEVVEADGAHGAFAPLLGVFVAGCVFPAGAVQRTEVEVGQCRFVEQKGQDQVMEAFALRIKVDSGAELDMKGLQGVYPGEDS